MMITLQEALAISDKAWEADSDGKLSGITRSDIWMLIEAIKERDKVIAVALDESVSALYLGDSSDYETQLWRVVDAIRKVPDEGEEEWLDALYHELNPDGWGDAE